MKWIRRILVGMLLIIVCAGGICCRVTGAQGSIGLGLPIFVEHAAFACNPDSGIIKRETILRRIPHEKVSQPYLGHGFGRLHGSRHLAACGSSGSSAVASSAAESTADSTAASTESGTPDYSNEDPINIRIYLSDNATLPYKEDWLTFTEVQKRCNVNLDVEAIPIADYSTKVSLALNTGENVPDVILYQSTTGENASLALNGALVPISDYSDSDPQLHAALRNGPGRTMWIC